MAYPNQAILMWDIYMEDEPRGYPFSCGDVSMEYEPRGYPFSYTYLYTMVARRRKVHTKTKKFFNILRLYIEDEVVY
jgi:hypothetical protein